MSKKVRKEKKLSDTWLNGTRYRKVRYETYFFASVIPCQVGPHQSLTPFHGMRKDNMKITKVKRNRGEHEIILQVCVRDNAAENRWLI